MTDTNGKGEAAAIAAADLDLIPSQMADAGKTAEDIWSELEATETGGADTGDPSKDAGEPEADKAEEGVQGAEPDPATAADPKQADPDAGKPDIWATATPEQKAAFEAVKAERDRFDHRIRSDQGRVRALQKRIDQLRSSVNDQDARKEPGSVSEALAALRENYPDIAEPLTQALGIVDGRLSEQDRKEQGRKDAARAELADTEAELAAIIRTEEATLTQAHPDWFDVLSKNGPAFQAWVEDQPRQMREAAYANATNIVDAKAASEVLAAFKAFLAPPATEAQKPIPETQPLNDKRKRQLDASASPRKPGSRPTVAGIPEDGDPAAIWAAFDAAESAA